MHSSGPRTFRLIIGVVMLLIGSYMLIRMYVLGLPPKVKSVTIDTMFAVFFILRGGLALRSARKRPEPPTSIAPRL